MIQDSSVLTTDLHWLAGFLEGEGSFICGPPNGRDSNLPIVTVETTDKDVVERAARIMGIQKMTSRVRVETREKFKGPRKPTYSIRFAGSKAVAWMRLLQPLMGSRRQGQIQKALDSYCPKRNRMLTIQTLIGDEGSRNTSEVANA
jgi:hypothetical protein